MKDKLTYVVKNEFGELPAIKTKVEFPDKKQVIFDSKAHFSSVLVEQSLRKDAEASQNSCEINLKTNLDYVLVYGTGDWHLGSEHVEYGRFQKDMELIKKTQGAYMVIVGDERDNFVNPKFTAGLFEGVLNPQQQADMHLGVLMDMNEKILARVGGNHTSWTWYQCGVNIENYWQEGMQSPLMRNGGFMHFNLNKQEYMGFLHHGISIFNSNFNPNHASKRAFEFLGPYDFMFSGHTHVSETAHSYRWADEFQKDYVQCRTGTYKLNDQYARSRQLGSGQPPGSCILFDTQEKRMIPFLKLEDGVEALQAMNTFNQLVAAGMLGMK